MLNPGTEKNIVEQLDIQQGQEAGIGLGHVPHPVDMLQPLPPPPPSSFDSKVIGNIIRNNTIVANDIGIWLAFQTKETLILENEINVNPSEGVMLERSHGNRLEGNTIFGSSGSAVLLEGSNNNTVLENDLSENDSGVVIDITRTGTVGQPSENNRVEKNTILEPAGAALEIIESDGNQLLDNVAHFGNGEGISLYRSDDTLVLGNDVSANKSGIELVHSSNNRLEENNASDSGSTGISIASLSLTNVLLKNESSNNDGDGIYIGDETTGGSGSWLEGNTVNNNKGFGIYISKVAHTVKANLANDNGGWGIWASEGSNGRHNVDAGGNKAQGNHGPLDPITLKPLQCFTIVCTGVDVPNSDIIAPGTQLLEKPADPSSTAVQRFRFDGSDNASPTVDLPVQARRGGVGPLHLAGRARARSRHPLVRGARGRCRGQRRPDAGGVRVVGQPARRRPGRRDDHGAPRTRPPCRPPRSSSSRLVRRARRSSASSTPARSRRAPRPRSTRASRSAPIRSPCGRSSSAAARRSSRTPGVSGRPRSHVRSRAARCCSRASR